MKKILSILFLFSIAFLVYAFNPIYKRGIITIDTVILLGQSNVWGGTNQAAPLTYTNTQVNTFVYLKPDLTYANTGRLQYYRQGLNNNQDNSGLSQVGPDISLGYNYFQMTGKQLLIIKYARSGSSLIDDGVGAFTNGLWQIDADSTRSFGLIHYRNLIHKILIPCIQQCAARDIKLNIISNIWGQGESEASAALALTSYTSRYKTEFIRLHEAIKTSLTPYNVLSPSFKPLIMKLHNSFTPGTRPSLALIKQSQDSICTYYNCQKINTDTFRKASDSTHFSAVGSISFGYMAAYYLANFYQ